ncbi:sulfotransferase [Sphingorhabdus sp. YGSMI21]|uniref:sulfotransferase family protein n=1 Tax=Sphingorhabdus sp. YGSMI21 TaxID=2077182 RepID=UPI0013DAF759|nr:sulfotransferase [Sphingorhabdus sp. YGSMI21]
MNLHPPLPNFFVIGTAKCGTTSLAQFFEQHPDVCFCEAHEPNFFAFDHYFQRGLKAYRHRYRHYKGEKAIGEKSWRYSCKDNYPEARDRMLAAIPTFKVIYIVRDPLPRALSMWRELRDGGQDRIPADPNEALSNEGIVVDSSRYARQLDHFEQKVGQENCKVMFFEDMVADPDSFYAALCEFLGIATFLPAEAIHANVSTGQRSDTKILELIRATGLAGLLRRWAPASLRKAARGWVKRPVREVPITSETERRFFELVGEDCVRLLEREGRAPAMWRLA